MAGREQGDAGVDELGFRDTPLVRHGRDEFAHQIFPWLFAPLFDHVRQVGTDLLQAILRSREIALRR